MEETNRVEQPGLVENVADSSQDKNASIATETQSCGSTFGKFKDATSLLSAYEHLEAEFTRKSQKVASLEKMLEKQTAASSETDNALTNNNIEKSNENVCGYAYEKENWKDVVQEFFDSNPAAKDYKKEMAMVITETPEIALSPKCLDLALAISKSRTLKEPAELKNDQNFLDNYVLNDAGIKDKIINNYIRSISLGDLPKVITGMPSTTVATPRAAAPKTIKEASNLAKKYLG